LRRLANLCADYGVRVQKSVFECWLDEDRFEELWLRLQAIIQTDDDQILAYTLDASAARRRRAAGDRATLSEKRRHYLL
jgi:CRISPR-associated protein Cas2